MLHPGGIKEHTGDEGESGRIPSLDLVAARPRLCDGGRLQFDHKVGEGEEGDSQRRLRGSHAGFREPADQGAERDQGHGLTAVRSIPASLPWAVYPADTHLPAGYCAHVRLTPPPGRPECHRARAQYPLGTHC